MLEMFLLNMAQEEMKGLYPWTYFEQKDKDVPIEAQVDPPQVGGAKMCISYDSNLQKYHTKVQNSRCRSGNTVPMEQNLQCFVANLPQNIANFAPLEVY